MPAPTVSVILLAHTRTQFVLEAARSVEWSAQGLEGIERIVVKKFEDPAIDATLSAGGWSLLPTDEDPLGAKVALGVRRATGEVVTFLEDDDAYEPGRLAELQRVFSADQALAFYRNGHRFVGPDGRTDVAPPGRAARQLARYGSVRAGPGELDRVLPQLCRVDPDFNLSAMAVRRSFLALELQSFEPLTAAVDSAVFYAVLRAGGGVRIDATPLTRYRVHGLNASLLARPPSSESLAKFLHYQDRFLRDLGPTVDATLAHGPPAARRLAASAWWGSRLLRAILDPAPSRRTIARDLGRFWRSAPLARLRERTDLSVYGLLGVLSPGAARRAYLRRRSLPNP